MHIIAYFKEMIRDILTNTVWRHDQNRNVSPNMDLGQQGLSCLLMHCMILFKELPEKETWLAPLTNLANNPELMVVRNLHWRIISNK